MLPDATALLFKTFQNKQNISCLSLPAYTDVGYSLHWAQIFNYCGMILLLCASVFVLFCIIYVF